MIRIHLKIAAAVLVLALFAAAVAFVVWANDEAPATEIALNALNSDSQVFVSAEHGWVIFHPAETPRPETGFIFYPGARVDYRAYAPVLRLIAAQGYFVVLTPAPLNIALFDTNAAARVQAAYPEIQNWFVGGHSLGGTAASAYAAVHPDIKGLALWASTPADDALLIRDTPVLSVYATNDGLFPLEMVKDSQDLLPADAEFVAIEGGNHAQFASYGPQAGDRAASIPPEEQWTLAANATTDFFEKVLR